MSNSHLHQETGANVSSVSQKAVKAGRRSNRAVPFARRPTQVDFYYQAVRRVAEVNKTFLELVNDGMTREELARNIERRPALWSRFSNWLDKLPQSEKSRSPTIVSPSC